MVNCKPEHKTIGAGLPSGIEERQIVDCQNSQGTALFGQNSVTIFCCMVRGLKIVLAPTLSGMEVHHAGVQVGFCRTHGPHQWRQVLMHVRDGQGLSVDCPPPHGHHECDWVDKAALVKGQQLVNGMCDLHLGNLQNGKWRCKFLPMVLQC